MDDIDTVAEDPRWDGFGLESYAQKAAAGVFAHLDIPPCEVCVMGCDDDRIAALNADFRGKPRPTNVLSWPSVEHRRDADGWPVTGCAGSLGDIAIAWETTMAEAAEQGKPPADHVTHLLVHAMLHLCGFDHETDTDAAVMESQEVAILAAMNIKNPYQETGL